MCRYSTAMFRTAAIAALCLGSAGSGAWAQQLPLWRVVGGTSVAEGLAGPAGGPVTDSWFSAAGDKLFVRTASGRIFEAEESEDSGPGGWKLNTAAAKPASDRSLASAAGAISPEPGAKTGSAAGRLYAAGKSDVFVSDDDGLTWVGVTSANGRSILGGAFTSLAISPADPREIVVTNAFGVWRSADGGISWRGLNDGLPNLPVRRLTARLSIALDDGSGAELAGGAWVTAAAEDGAAALRTRFSSNIGAEVTAAAQTSTVAYAGTADGRLLASRDSGATWPQIQRAPNGGPVSRIWTDATQPEMALASAGGRLLRTLNGGQFWDDVSGSLPDSHIHGMAADAAADRVWIATDRGLFEARIPLDAAAPASPDWRAAGQGLPAATVWDVRLNNDNTLEVAVDGYGVYETEQPQAGSLRVANGADLSDRAAAPGSLISVIGAKVDAGRSGGANWPVLAVSARTSQLQVPFETAAGALTLAIQTAGGTFSVPVQVKEASPAIFVDADGAPLLLDPASGLVLDPKAPVAPAASVQILVTGLGRVNPDWPTGIPAPSDTPPAVRGSVTAYLDGAPVEVTRATLAPGYVGYYVVELTIPAGTTRGMRELRIVMNGEESNPVKMFVGDAAAELR